MKVIQNCCYLYHLLEMLTKVNELMVDMFKVYKETDQSNMLSFVQVPYLAHTLRHKVRFGKKPFTVISINNAGNPA